MTRLLLIVALLSLLPSCGGKDADQAPELNRTAAQEQDAAKATKLIFELLGRREYETVYDAASAAFKAGNSKDDFLEKMRELEVFGDLSDTEEPKAVEFDQQDGRQLAHFNFETEYALGAGPFQLTLAGAPSGAWELDYYKYDISATTSNPPYPSTEKGADRLARRFLYLWQTRRYDEIASTMKLQQEPEKLNSFFDDLGKAGKLRSLRRIGYLASGVDKVKVEYDLVFEKGSGIIQFILARKDEEWLISDDKSAVKYDVEFLKK